VISVRVKLFAAARDLVGTGETELSLQDGSRASDVLDHFLKARPELSNWKNHLRVAVNAEYVELDHRLQSGDEVAIIPPVSGG
jgi:molybdopterin synthase sulfur carrier subunit